MKVSGVCKYDIGCGESPGKGYTGIDPLLGNSFWELKPVSDIAELRFVHSIYMLDNNFSRKEDVEHKEIQRALRLYKAGDLSIFELNKTIFGKDSFIDYYTQLKTKLRELADKMVVGGQIVIEQPVINKMVMRRHGRVKELYRIIQYNLTSEKQGITAEFYRTRNFMTCDKSLLVDLLEALNMKDISVTDGTLEGSIHWKENCIVVTGTK